MGELNLLVGKSRQSMGRAWEMAGREAPEAVNVLARESKGGLTRLEANRLVRLLRPELLKEVASAEFH